MLGSSFFYHNNFIDAWTAKYTNEGVDPNFIDNINGTNKWDSTNGGNYWSDYNGQDVNHDGMGDTPYIVNGFNQDNYPLMNPLDIEKEPQPQLTP